jgi:predicted DNA binding CopG/RHH family protein
LTSLLTSERKVWYSICMKRVNYYLPERQMESLKEESSRLGLSISELIRRAIDEWIQRQKKGRE